MTEEQLHFMVALPRIDGRSSSDDLSDGVAGLVDAVRDWWTGPAAPPVRMLPAAYDASLLPPPDGDMRMALGIEEHELLPFWHDFEQNPHLVVVGDVQSGKTNLLKLVADAIAQRYSSSQARIALVDVRRELYESVSDEHRLAYAVSIDALKEIVGGTAKAVQTRVPGPDITPDRLRRRDWWKGPQMFFLVDDYELVAGSLGDSPFAPLLPFISQGAELGLHIIVARSANGVGRASNDPLLRRLLESNTPTVMLSTPPSEGYFVGNAKPRQLPPGRALYVTRRGPIQIQTALKPDPANVDQ
jgi:S-DNA-T family DNA segregation ATPase FtsK/SpoIIIE